MHIEVIGCTGAGKTSLVGGILRVARERGIRAITGEEWILTRPVDSHLRGRLARTLTIDALAAVSCTRTWSRYGEFATFALRHLRSLPIPRLQKLNLGRNVLKRLGVYELVRPCDRDTVVVVDEGTVHSAHYLFVHPSWPPALDRTVTFARLVPLPDVVVYVCEPPATLVERTMVRGHARILDGSRVDVTRFVDHAVSTFAMLRQERPGSRMLLAEPSTGTLQVPDQADADLASAAELVRAALALGHRSQARGPSGIRIPALDPSGWRRHWRRHESGAL
jgi:hypothetical protein